MEPCRYRLPRGIAATSHLRRLFVRLQNVLRPGSREQDLALEIDAHLALLEDDFVRRGLTTEQARRAARLALGGAEQTKERHRDARSMIWLDDLRRDVQYALVGMDPATGLTMGYEGMTMPAIATMLVGFPEIDRPIRDRTRLTGAFDLQLTLPMPLAPGQGPPGAAPNLGAGTDSGILTALAEQLGLKLEGRRDQADVIVVDSVEQPTAD